MEKVIVIGNSLLEISIPANHMGIAAGEVIFTQNDIQTCVSGIGFNVALSLHTLGRELEFLTLLGQDAVGTLIRAQIVEKGISANLVRQTEAESGIAIIRSQAGATPGILLDLKQAHDRKRIFEIPPVHYSDFSLAVCCFIRFSEGMLDGFSSAGIPIASDVQVIDDVNDPEKQPYLEHSEILFLSNQAIAGHEAAFLKALKKRYRSRIIAVGMGEKGTLMALRDQDELWHFPAVFTRPVVNTIGCGDALFSCFLHGYLKSGDPVRAMSEACVYASYKAGESGASRGFLNPDELAEWVGKTAVNGIKITS